MKKVYIATKYERNGMEILDTLKKIILAAGYAPYAFVEEGFIADEREMMRLALGKLEESDILIVDGTNPAMGVGIEVGYFLHSEKPIIAIFKEGSFSRTLSGVAKNTVIYSSEKELGEKLSSELRTA